MSGELSLKELKIGLNYYCYGLELISWGHTSAVIAWGVATVIAGFCDGIFHGTPLAWEILLVKLIASCIGFSINKLNVNEIIVDLKTKEYLIGFTIFLLLIGIVLNGVHLGFSVSEFISCSTRICIHPATHWVLIVFAILLVVIIMFELVMIFYLAKYQKCVRLTVKRYEKNKNP